MEILIAIIASLFALFFSGYLTVQILKRKVKDPKMKEISDAIKEGAMAYLNRLYRTVSIFVVVLTIVLNFLINYPTALSFFLGAFCSALAGYVGMNVSVRANVRTAEAAKKGLKNALDVAFKGGTVTGMAVVGLGLLGTTLLFNYYKDPNLIIGFGFGASLISLFARVGGGIYTKAADVGADLVGKVEKGIPEDDPRNPAVIADNVGDNVGDCAGMAADLFESYVVTIIAAMILGISLGKDYVLFPLLVSAVALFASIIGTFFVKIDKRKKIWKALNKGILTSCLLSTLGFLVLTYKIFSELNLFYALLGGIITTISIGYITEYYTSKDRNPVREVAKAAQTGAGTNLIAGLAIGFMSTALPVIVICLAILVAYSFSGVYGIAIAAVGMLSTSGIVIAVDSYGPITDNAGGIAEMSGLPSKVRKVTDALDAVGNTTKAVTKGFAIGSAALAALSLFTAYADATGLHSIDIMRATVVVGLFIGAMIPFVFSAFCMRAVGRAAFKIVEEVRRQFKEIKGLMKGKAKPDYSRCVDISTSAALRELLVPGLIAVCSPLLVGFLLGVEALGGLLGGSIASGFILAITMTTSGATWDNAKKFIEDGNYGGKGSEAHKASVVGDTVGDPFKDTAGPSLNPLIKVLNMISLIFAGIFVLYTLL